MNLAAAYASLTVPQLKEMLAAARNDRRIEVAELKEKHAAEVLALKQALIDAEQKWAAVLQRKDSDNAMLRRDLHSTRDELERAHILLAEQTKRLLAYEQVAQLEKKLQSAKRLVP